MARSDVDLRGRSPRRGKPTRPALAEEVSDAAGKPAVRAFAANLWPAALTQQVLPPVGGAWRHMMMLTGDVGSARAEIVLRGLIDIRHEAAEATGLVTVGLLMPECESPVSLDGSRVRARGIRNPRAGANRRLEGKPFTRADGPVLTGAPVSASDHAVLAQGGRARTDGRFGAAFSIR